MKEGPGAYIYILIFYMIIYDLLFVPLPVGLVRLSVMDLARWVLPKKHCHWLGVVHLSFFHPSACM